MIKNKTIRYNLEKNELLKEQRDISFEDVILALESGKLSDDIEYPNQNLIQILIHQFATNKIHLNM